MYCLDVGALYHSVHSCSSKIIIFINKRKESLASANTHRTTVGIHQPSTSRAASLTTHRLLPRRNGREASPVTMCGVIGIVLGDRNAQVSPELYDALTILQHRGQDAAGIATSDGRKIYLRKDKGLVRERERERDLTPLGWLSLHDAFRGALREINQPSRGIST